jgi:acetylornithine deacetylase/succinyl-diaminopimelate desuccinylase-like protein
LLPPGFNTMTPGIIMGGPGGGHDGRLNMIGNPGTAPDYCSLEYNIWYYPGESLAEVKAEIEGQIAAFARADGWLSEHPPSVTWALRGISFPPATTEAGHDAVQTMKRAMSAAGVPERVEGATFVTDLSWYAQAGTPGFVFAPGSIDQAHAPNEYVEVERLVEATKAVALMLVDWAA